MTYLWCVIPQRLLCRRDYRPSNTDPMQLVIYLRIDTAQWGGESTVWTSDQDAIKPAGPVRSVRSGSPFDVSCSTSGIIYELREEKASQNSLGRK